MTRDELIEELKKAPANGEVQLKLVITPDFFEKICDKLGRNPRRECYVAFADIQRITTIPAIVIEVIP